MPSPANDNRHPASRRRLIVAAAVVFAAMAIATALIRMGGSPS